MAILELTPLGTRSCTEASAWPLMDTMVGRLTHREWPHERTNERKSIVELGCALAIYGRTCIPRTIDGHCSDRVARTMSIDSATLANIALPVARCAVRALTICAPDRARVLVTSSAPVTNGKC